jgi:hypothetical protein
VLCEVPGGDALAERSSIASWVDRHATKLGEGERRVGYERDNCAKDSRRHCTKSTFHVVVTHVTHVSHFAA